MALLPQSYLETEILTAPPQKLQLLMIEAAIRFSRLAQGHWEAGEDERACEALIRAQRIVTELVNGLNREQSPELVQKITAVYLFIFRSLMEASFERDEKKLGDALRVLEVERETWRQVCQQVGRAADAKDDATDVATTPATATRRPAAIPSFSADTMPLDAMPRFSLDA
jgi:flagellar secretion chaperone FliS